jgi:hypothetical protein
MTYIPRRDYRFEYLTEAASFIEERQCETCAFKSDRPEYPMCFEIEAVLWDEKPIVEWDDLGDQGLHCTKYRWQQLVDDETNQEKLF